MATKPGHRFQLTTMRVYSRYLIKIDWKRKCTMQRHEIKAIN